MHSPLNGSRSPSRATAGSYGAVQRFGDEYDELLGGSVPCPTCQGAGRIPKDHPIFAPPREESHKTCTKDQCTEEQRDVQQTLDAPTQEKITADSSELSAITKKVQDEIREAGINQEIFAAVALHRTQPIVSSIIRAVEKGQSLTESMQLNVQLMKEFLDREEEERRQLYAEYRASGITRQSRRLKRQHLQDIGPVKEVPPPQSSPIISAHARDVMQGYLQQQQCPGQLPSDRELQVMAEVLDMDSALVKQFCIDHCSVPQDT